MGMENKKFKVCLHGASRNYNYGDVLLMDIYKNWIEEFGGEVIMDMANDYYGAYLGVESRMPIAKAVGQADYVVFGGGGYFGEPRKTSLRWRARFVLEHMLPAIIARAKGKPYGFFGIGFGPLKNWFIRKVGMYVMNGAAIVSVRDEESKLYLKEYGYSKEIHVVPDSALSIGCSPSKYNIKQHLDAEKEVVAIHTPLDPGEDYKAIKPALLTLLKDFQKDNPETQFCFLVDHGLGKECYQYSFFEEIKSELGVDWFIKDYKDPFDTLSFLSSCTTVITTKLHVAITSYAIGVKPIGISKHPKTKRFFKQVGLSDFHFNLYDLLNVEKVVEIKEAVKNRENIIVNDDLLTGSAENSNLLKLLFKIKH